MTSTSGAHLARTTCSAPARRALLDRYPQAVGDAVLFRALAYLTFSSARDRDTGRLLIGASATEFIAGSPIYHSSTRTGAFRSGEQVLEYVRDRVLPGFRWTGWDARRRCRLVMDDGIDPSVHALVIADLATPVRELERRVYLLTGETYSRRRRAAQQQSARDRAATVPAPSETAAYLVQRMNDAQAHPANAYAPLLRGMAEAKSAALATELRRADGEGDAAYESRQQGVRRLHLATLRAIEDEPQPVYQPSRRARTDRIFPAGPSLLQVPKAIRGVLTDAARWTELDLVAAQAAIASARWGCPQTKALLAGGGSMWDELFEICDLGRITRPSNEYDEIKGALKTGIYSTIFGMRESAVIGSLSSDLRLVLGKSEAARTARRFKMGWVARELFDARDTVFGEIREQGGLDTPTGILARLDEDAGVDEASVLATVAQSFEAELIKPVLEYEERHHAGRLSASRRPDFRVLLLVHDGVYVRFKDEKARQRHVPLLQAAVAEVADRYGIPTRLA